MNRKIKHKLFLILLVTLFVNNQNIEAQRTKAVLEFKDGTKLSGLGKLKGIDKVKFRKNKKAKPTKYHFKELKSATIYEFSGGIKYVYLYVKEKDEYKVLQESIVGEVSLYKTITNGQHVGMGFGGMGFGGIGMGTSFTIEGYYLKRKGEEYVSHLGSTGAFSKNFKKSASNYFKDCPELIDKINKKEYKKRDIETIVKFYNNNCTKR